MNPVVSASHLNWTAQLNKGKNPTKVFGRRTSTMDFLRGVRRPESAGTLRTQFRNAGLPAVPAVTAISATAASATAAAATTTATTMAAASTAGPTATAASATAAAALCLGTRFIHNEVSPAEIL